MHCANLSYMHYKHLVVFNPHFKVFLLILSFLWRFEKEHFWDQNPTIFICLDLTESMATFWVMKTPKSPNRLTLIVQNNVPLCPSMKLLLRWFNQICSICVLVLRHLANGANSKQRCIGEWRAKNVVRIWCSSLQNFASKYPDREDVWKLIFN